VAGQRFQRKNWAANFIPREPIVIKKLAWIAKNSRNEGLER